MTLEDRIAKLEAKLVPQEQEPLYLLRVFVAPGQKLPLPDPEYQHLQCGGQTWARLDDESEDAFKARAMREVARSKGPLVFAVNQRVARLLQAP
ncbi:MAG: hypothetical protein IPO43_21415 [Rhodoferax sp.]|nr:hypothetical protein [Rhodoferax sp.]